MALNTKNNNLSKVAAGQLEAGNHECRVVAVIYMGSHETTFEGVSTGVKPMMLAVFEAGDEQDDQGNNKIIAKEFAFSTHEKSFLKKLCLAALGAEPPDGYDLDKLINKPVSLAIKHSPGGYAKIDGVSALREQAKAKVRKLDNVPFFWDGSDGRPYVDCDFVPWVFSESLKKRVKVSEMIAASLTPVVAGSPDEATAGAV